MSNRYIDSFDHYSQGQFLRKWVANSTAVSSNPPIVTGRNGSGMQLSGASAFLTFPEEKSTWIIGAAYKITGFAGTIFEQYGLGGGGYTFEHVGDGRLKIGFGVFSTPSTFTMAVDTFYYLEVKVTTSVPSLNQLTATFEVHATASGGSAQTILTFSNTVGTTTTGFNRVVLAGPGGGLAAVFDDLYINDGDGTKNNDFMGDVKIQAIFPDADGANTAWSLSSGGSHFALVDENPATDDTDYVYSSTSGQIDTNSFQPVTLVNAPKAVQLSLCSRKSDGRTRILRHVFRHSTGAQDVPAVDSRICNEYLYWRYNWDRNPVTAADWTEADINNGEFGVKMEA